MRFPAPLPLMMPAAALLVPGCQGPAHPTEPCRAPSLALSPAASAAHRAGGGADVP